MAGEKALRGLVEGTGLQAAAQWTEVARYEDAFRTGRGIGWDEHGPAHSRGMDLISRAVVVPALAGWLAALDGVGARLEAGGVVADVGCGYGAPTIAMAQEFTRSRFLGIDADDASVARARKAAAEAGVAGRVTFEVADAGRACRGQGYDLVTFFDCLHDMGDPVGCAARRPAGAGSWRQRAAGRARGIGARRGEPEPGGEVLLRRVGAGVHAKRPRPRRCRARYHPRRDGAARCGRRSRVLPGQPGGRGCAPEPPAATAALTDRRPPPDNGQVNATGGLDRPGRGAGGPARLARPGGGRAGPHGC